MLEINGFTMSTMYSGADVHRVQTAALLDGHFWLSKSIADVEFDNTFYSGSVQQVWGLGYPLLLLPFEWGARVLGVSPFPDRVLMLACIACGLYYGMTLVLPGRSVALSLPERVAIVALVLLSPPLWTLIALGPHSNYDDPSVYGLLAASTILFSLIRVYLFGLRRDILICGFVAGMAGLIRPTHLVAAGAGVGLVAVIIYFRYRSRVPTLVVSMTMAIAGVAFLFYSNSVRFGHWTEFGHKLTATTSDGLLTSRFINPFTAASVPQAVGELIGALFLCYGNIRDKGAFDQALFIGQTPYFRCRDFYVSAFDATLLLFVIAGFATSLVLLARVNRMRGGPALPVRDRNRLGWITRGTDLPLTFYLLVWGVMTAGAVGAFMLYYPGLYARYLYDMWPGLIAITIPFWMTLVRNRGWLLIGLLMWVVFECARMDCRIPWFPKPTADQIVRRNFDPNPSPALATDGYFNADHPPPVRAVGQGYRFFNLSQQNIDYVATIAIDCPKFVEIVVGPRDASPAAPGRVDHYRARIGLHELPLTSVTLLPGGMWRRVRFEVPKVIADAGDDELLFLSFSAFGDVPDQFSHRPFRSIRWR